MRLELRTRSGRTLGQLQLADGVTLADVGRALLEGVAAPVAVVAPERPAAPSIARELAAGAQNAIQLQPTPAPAPARRAAR